MFGIFSIMKNKNSNLENNAFPTNITNESFNLNYNEYINAKKYE